MMLFDRFWLSRTPIIRKVASLLAVALVLLVGPEDATAMVGSAAAVPPQGTSPIRHVIEIMLENHTFDNLFGTFPGADGIPSKTRLPNPQAYYQAPPPVSPFFAGPNEGAVLGINNSRPAEIMQMHYRPGSGYRMNYYTLFPKAGLAAITLFGPQFDPNEQFLAHHFVLADHNFQPAIAPTQPNVLYGLAATSDGWMYNNEPPSSLSYQTIFDQLSAHGLSWKIYFGLPVSLLAGSVWYRLVPPGTGHNLTSTAQFLTDLSGGHLPAFSFVRPGFGYSEGDGEDLQLGDAWLGQLVQAVMNSKYWNSTAIFVTYDEGGGFWDHVPPPRVSRYGYGTRTPMLIISPWVRPGILHQTTTNISVLSFMQHLWGLGPLNALNAQQPDLWSVFDFHQKPLPPMQLPAVPPVTLYMHGPRHRTPVGSPYPVDLVANTPGLSVDSTLSGTVHLQAVAPPGGKPAVLPSTVPMKNGSARFTVTFPTPGYYRLIATGPDGAKGWATVAVETTQAVLPSPSPGTGAGSGS